MSDNTGAAAAAATVAGAAAAAATVAAATQSTNKIDSDKGKAESSAIETIQKALHIEQLMYYLPIIVLVLIILISMVSSDLLEDNWHVFATLVIAFIFVTFFHYITPTTFDKLENSNPSPTFLPKIAEAIDLNSINKKYYLLAVFILFFGIALGFASIDVSGRGTNYDPSSGLITVGSLMLGAGILYLLMIAFKFIPRLKHLSIIQQIPLSKLPLFILLIIIGIPIVVRGNEIKNDLDTKLKDDQLASDEYQKGIANTSADAMLGVGLFFQIVIFIAFGYCLWNLTSSKKLDMKTVIAISGFILSAIIMPGSLFLSKSQGGPGFEKTEEEKAKGGTYEDKAYLVHGIIYIITGVLLFIVLFGQTERLKVFKGLFYVLPVILIIFIIISLVLLSIQASETTDSDVVKDDKDSVYYQQLRAEAVKEVQQKNPNGFDTDKDFEGAVDKVMEERLQKLDEKLKNPVITVATLTLSSFISFIIIGFFLGFHFYRKKTIESTELSYDVKKKIKEDKMLSSDWDKIVTDIETNKISQLSKGNIVFAKGFDYVPFLSVILLVLWVSTLFTSVTTSPKTSDWISKNFTGDMFPRVKELIDTFFIVIIVGLLLCAILLFPIVKEMNVGGLDSILKFAESVQVWQFNKNNANPINGGWTGVFIFIAIFVIGLSWWWHYLLNEKKENLPIVPENWGWAIALVVLLAVCAIPTGYHIWGGIHTDFGKESIPKQIVRGLLTTIYLIPWLIVLLFRIGIYSIGSLTGIQAIVNKRDEEINKLKFWEWNAGDIDLRMFPTNDNGPTPESVTSGLGGADVADESSTSSPSTPPSTGISETKVSAVGKLIKVILLIISFVILILTVIYYVYKIDADFINKGAESDAVASGGIMTKLNSPTAQVIYVLLAIVAVAGFVAYIREKFKQTNDNKTPENYLFDDMKTGDEQKPLRQLTFGATHIVYIILMVIVWIYDRDKDDNDRMSVTGMTVLGIAILFFHFTLEFIDTMNPVKMVGGADTKPSVTDLFSNVRFIINTVFFILLCSLAYYKQHSVMVLLVLLMFFFHLTKSYIGIKILKLLWLCIIFIPCLFLDMLSSSQSAVGDTTRTIWIILAIELLLIAILYGGPYLLNYIGASASQIVAAPVTLKRKYDTNLTTQSPQIFIYHNTGIDRSPEDDAANCPVEEKVRYNYSISGWFLLNNSAISTNQDLEIFDFGGVPKMTYNKSTTELKLWCNTLDMSGSSTSKPTLIYNSKTYYNKIISGKSENKQNQIRMFVENEGELDTSIPLQKWNYFVVNYNGKTMDLFINTKLITRSDFIMPDIVMKPITVGDTLKNKGLNGSICNFAFHKVPLTKEQIRWTYTMLKSQNPPMIGMNTIEDEVKNAGTTAVYSK